MGHGVILITGRWGMEPRQGRQGLILIERTTWWTRVKGKACAVGDGVVP